MTTETMIEKLVAGMATEIQRQARSDDGSLSFPSVGDLRDDGLLGFDGLLDLKLIARAALQALREPSISMCMDGESAAFDAKREERKWLDDAKKKFGGVPSFISRVPQATFTAMIDAALQEKAQHLAPNDSANTTP